jgi:hypothetical protein
VILNRSKHWSCLLSTSPIDGGSNTHNLPAIQKLLGPFKISAIQFWLRARKLPYSAVGRDEIAKRVFESIDKKKLAYSDLVDGLIGIEESKSKTVHLVRVADDKYFASKVDKQLADLKTPLAASRTLATVQSTTPKLIYAINNAKQFRMKWGETQTSVKLDKKTFEPVKVSMPVIFVFVLDKSTGVGQLRYEAPQMIHSHKVDGEIRQQAYFDFYKEKCENMTGLAFEPLDLRERLKELLLKQPPVVVPVTMSTIGEDEQTVIYGSRTPADPRTLKDFKSAMTKDAQPRTFEKAPLRWQHQMTNYKLYRNLWCSIDGAAGTVFFDADCTEDEVDYVISETIQ